MATSGSQPGNDNAHKGGVYRHALKRALAELADKHGFTPDYEIGLKIVAQQVVDKAAAGDLVAAQQVGDRFDGKPAQTITGADGGPMIVQCIQFAGTPGADDPATR